MEVTLALMSREVFVLKAKKRWESTYRALDYSFLLVCVLGSLFFLILAEHPLRMGFGLAVYSLVTAIMVGEDYFSYYGYVMYFVYVGTLMVVFCIVVRLAPNPVFRVTPLVVFYFFQLGGRVVNDLYLYEDEYEAEG